MNLPSLDHIYQKANATLRRFPFTLFSAVLVTVISIYLANPPSNEPLGLEMLRKIEMCAALGIAFFTAITLTVEKREGSSLTWWISHAVGVLLLVAYYFTLSESLDGTDAVTAYRYGLFVLGLHLLVSIGPYWGEEGNQGFWQYNKRLFLRFLTALLFSMVLYAGLAIALLAIQLLFSVQIEPRRYFQLFAFIIGIFNTWFFLAGIPSSLEVFERDTTYPKGLKIFTQNVLLPLVVIYLVILYLYMIKIIMQWSWPEGWVAILVLSFSIAGILAILLLYPIRSKADHKWINRFYTGYFAALVPLVMLLLLAIYRRVADYGITINRYLVVVLALWLAGIVAYFLVSRTKNIKVIPGSLCVVAFLISFGPWGAFSVSRRSQVNRLASLLKKNEILRNGSIHQPSSEISSDTRAQIGSKLRYLNETNDLDAIQPWFSHNLTQKSETVNGRDSVKTIPHYSRPSHALELMGIGRDHESDTDISAGGRLNGDGTITYFQLRAEQTNIFPVDHARWFIRDYRWTRSAHNDETYPLDDWLEDRVLVVKSHQEQPIISIHFEDDQERPLEVDLQKIADQLSKVDSTDHDITRPMRDLTFPVSNDVMSIKLYIKNLEWHVENDSVQVSSGRFSIAVE